MIELIVSEIKQAVPELEQPVLLFLNIEIEL